MKSIKIRHKDIYPDGAWVIVSSEEARELIWSSLEALSKERIPDTSIYFYLETEAEVEAIRPGQTVELDETFEVLEVEDVEHN